MSPDERRAHGVGLPYFRRPLTALVRTESTFIALDASSGQAFTHQWFAYNHLMRIGYVLGATYATAC
ncbi:hypothetical protein FHR37_002830 [Actinopolymorpha cephalotaxi]|uniref:Uncharacterized protein n=1 Tax=Actinopolymorpha cephalotaxi TaxID=504797 RepID=A0ABX2S316_9ACTN|nr:hypothetical protein [Actinopolymorpha cephalotaxi]